VAGPDDLPEPARAAGLASARWLGYRCVRGTSRKFWRIRHSGRYVQTWWGRIGTEGQAKVKSHANPAAAQRWAEELVVEKVTKGYEPEPEPGPGGGPPTSGLRATLAHVSAEWQRGAAQRATPAPAGPERDPLTGRVAVYAQRDVRNDGAVVHVRGSAQMLNPTIAAEVVASRGADGRPNYGYQHPDGAGAVAQQPLPSPQQFRMAETAARRIVAEHPHDQIGSLLAALEYSRNPAHVVRWLQAGIITSVVARRILQAGGHLGEVVAGPSLVAVTFRGEEITGTLDEVEARVWGMVRPGADSPLTAGDAAAYIRELRARVAEAAAAAAPEPPQEQERDRGPRRWRATYQGRQFEGIFADVREAIAGTCANSAQRGLVLGALEQLAGRITTGIGLNPTAAGEWASTLSLRSAAGSDLGAVSLRALQTRGGALYEVTGSGGAGAGRPLLQAPPSVTLSMDGGGPPAHIQSRSVVAPRRPQPWAALIGAASPFRVEQSESSATWVVCVVHEDAAVDLPRKFAAAAGHLAALVEDGCLTQEQGLAGLQIVAAVARANGEKVEERAVRSAAKWIRPPDPPDASVARGRFSALDEEGDI
jgi:predicted DNA-binding WGR domain protein